MPVIINGSTGISGTDGSAGTPAVQGTDTNTGMFFPAADQIAFAEGGVEAMRLDASGNVGIGTTTPNSAGLTVAKPSGTAGMRVQSGANSTDFVMSGTDAYISNNAAGTLQLWTNNTERARITSGGDFQFNSGYGSVATAFGCRAWVYFNGTGTVAINGSGNVSSITDNGTARYTVNFATAMPDANYSVAGTCSNNDNNPNENGVVSYGSTGTYSATAVQVWTVENTGGSTIDIDMPRISVMIFR